MASVGAISFSSSKRFSASLAPDGPAAAMRSQIRAADAERATRRLVVAIESGAEVAHCGHERIDDWAAIGRTLDHQDIFVLFFAHRFQRSQRRRTWQVRLAAR